MDPIDRLKRIRHIALDLDGTVYEDSDVFETTRPFLERLTKLNIGHSFVTNNSSLSTEEYVTRLCGMGIPAKAADIYISTHATIEFLRREMPELHRLFVLGTEALRGEFSVSGFVVCEDEDLDDQTPEPDGVVVGFDKTLTYRRLCRAAYWIARGKPFIATHPDHICPTSEPTVLVDCGSICAALEQATGREPVAIPGKPDRRMIGGLLARHRLEPDDLAMVGDRLYTDMAMARAAGSLGVLVLTGETTAEQAASCQPPPDLVVRDLAELGHLLDRARGAIDCR